MPGAKDECPRKDRLGMESLPGGQHRTCRSQAWRRLAAGGSRVPRLGLFRSRRASRQQFTQSSGWVQGATASAGPQRRDEARVTGAPACVGRAPAPEVTGDRLGEGDRGRLRGLEQRKLCCKSCRKVQARSAWSCGVIDEPSLPVQRPGQRCGGHSHTCVAHQ